MDAAETKSAAAVPGTLMTSLLEIEPLELARQLTLLETRLFLEITPTECLAYGKDSTTDGQLDNIENVVFITSRVGRHNHNLHTVSC